MNETKESLFKRFKNRIKNFFGSSSDGFDAFKSLFGFLPVKVFLVIAAFSLAVPLISALSENFAEFYSRTIGGFFRMMLAKITGILPFSLAETIIVFAFFGILYCIVRDIMDAVKKTPDEKRFCVFANRVIVCAVLFAFSVYNLAFASCNSRRPLEENMGLERNPLTASRLYSCSVRVIDELNECIENGDIRRTPDGSSVLPYSYAQLNKLLNWHYVKYAEKYPFINSFSSNAKRLALSELMTYTHISGIYIPYTGEVNINTNYPDYVITFTYAHEMAHQRGISREDEANFTAFTMMYESGNEYLRYCALMQLFDYLMGALAEADTELFYTALYSCDEGIFREMNAFNDFFVPYRDSTASAVMGAVNDTSIKLRGDSDGEKSYNLMIELAAAYFGV